MGANDVSDSFSFETFDKPNKDCFDEGVGTFSVCSLDFTFLDSSVYFDSSGFLVAFCPNILPPIFAPYEPSAFVPSDNLFATS